MGKLRIIELVNVAGYTPLRIAGNESGLIQERQKFLLPNDAYPTLENAFVWRETIKRKQGFKLLGRLRRALTTVNLAAYSTIIGTNTISIFTDLGLIATEPNASIELGSTTSISIVFPAPISQSLTNTTGTGTLTVVGAGPITSATINYATGVVSITASAAVGPVIPTFTGAYYPGLPVMGLRTRETLLTNDEQLVAFDTKYAYKFNGAVFVEFIPGTTWTGTNSDFFWSTNYWVDDADDKIFWVTNTLSQTGDPIRYTDGAIWVNFAPTIDAGGDKLQQALMILPFRSRLLALNTLEGPNKATATAYRQRIRWAAIGNPFSDVSAIVTTVNVDAWRDDKRGQGGFLDIPTSEDIIAAGFVRDNLVIFCERSTWQLRYTGNQIAPFQIEKVNTELGAESTFSAVAFDTSLVGIGDKGVVECDSFKSIRFDEKIIDLVWKQIQNKNQGAKRVHGIRDIPKKLAYWTYPNVGDKVTFPNRRLVYNYENNSWAIFTDSLTTLGNFQPFVSRTWANTKKPAPWSTQNYTWVSQQGIQPQIVGGNQQGFVEILDYQVNNDISLFITTITANNTTATELTIPNHNLESGSVIKISGIPTATGYSSLNGLIFGVTRTDANKVKLFTYDSLAKNFSTPRLDASQTYIGGGVVQIRDNFSIVSKKFEQMEQGQKIQIGYVDILMSATSLGAITMNMYMDYLDTIPTNNGSDEFFNTIIPTSNNGFNPSDQEKYWHRVYCTLRANFVQIEYTLSNAQLAGIEQESEVEIDAQIIWNRLAGRLTI